MRPALRFLPDEESHEATRLLPYVMAVMVYLSALALMGSMLLHNGFGAWTESLSNRLTVQISTADHDQRAAQVTKAAQTLRNTPGIDHVRALNKVEIEALLEPWLGEGNVTSDLPIPAILDVTVSRSLTVDIEALKIILFKISQDIHLDDHQQWLGRFLRLMDMVEYTALGILFLVTMASIAMIIFGAKAGMAENREIIAIMHHLGAEDRMIARAYQDRFMVYGFKGGLMGLLLAFITVISLIYLSRDLVSGLSSRPEFPLVEISVLLVIPFFAAAISLLTARITVMRNLRRMV